MLRTDQWGCAYRLINQPDQAVNQYLEVIVSFLRAKDITMRPSLYELWHGYKTQQLSAFQILANGEAFWDWSVRELPRKAAAHGKALTTANRKLVVERLESVVKKRTLMLRLYPFPDKAVQKRHEVLIGILLQMLENLKDSDPAVSEELSAAYKKDEHHRHGIESVPQGTKSGEDDSRVDLSLDSEELSIFISVLLKLLAELHNLWALVDQDSIHISTAAMG